MWSSRNSSSTNGPLHSVVTDQKMWSSRNLLSTQNSKIIVVTDQKMRSSRNSKTVIILATCVVTDQKMRSSRNYVTVQTIFYLVVTDQKMRSSRNSLNAFCSGSSGCNRLENAVKPQQTISEIRTWPHVSAYKMRSGCKHGQKSQYCSLNTTD